MYIDAHFHADDLQKIYPGFVEEYRNLGVFGLASVHDMAGFEATNKLLAGAGAFIVSFGMHPQLAVLDQAGQLENLAAAGKIAAVGEFGFDFFGEAPDLVRTPDNERTQRKVFEFQLDLAQRHQLPVVLHLRRANDLLFEYAGRLATLPAVILHSWAGPANEALDFLSRCPQALFSFSNSVVSGNKKARVSVAALPLAHIVSETDAPYQPPRGEPLPGSASHRRPLARDYSTFSDIPAIVAEIAAIKGLSPESVQAAINKNFTGVFAHAF